jgi:hypothetical protein
VGRNTRAFFIYTKKKKRKKEGILAKHETITASDKDYYTLVYLMVKFFKKVFDKIRACDYL